MSSSSSSSSFILSNDDLYELLQVKRPRIEKKEADTLDFKPFVDIQSMNPRIQRIVLDWHNQFRSSLSTKIPLPPIDQLFFQGSMLWIPMIPEFLPFLTFMKNKLQYRPKSTGPSLPDPKPYPLYAERTAERVLGIPATIAREVFGAEIWSKTQTYECWNCMHADFEETESTIKIGNGKDNTIPQQQCVDAVFKAWEEEQFPVAYLNAYCGAGKTVMALEIIRRNGRRCAFVVADTGIARQTEQRIKTFLPGARIGWIHGDRCEVIGKDIVIVSLKSLLSRGEFPPLHDYSPDEFLNDIKEFTRLEREFATKKTKKQKAAASAEEIDDYDFDFDDEKTKKSMKYKKYPWQLLATCNLVVLDEAHGFVSQKHSTVFQYFCPQRILTLTATPTREGRECVEVMWILGRTAALLERPTQPLQVKSFRIESDIKNPPYDKHGNILYSQAMTNLSRDKRRNQKIVGDILFAVETEHRTVLVLSYRKSQLVDLASEFLRLQTNKEKRIGLYFPESKKTTGILTSNVIFATYQRAAQALDVQELDTVFLCLPIKSHTKQVVGRILRSGGKAVAESRKNVPTVYDYVDPYCTSFFQLWRSRKRFYEENDYEIDFVSCALKDVELNFTPDVCRSNVLAMLDETEKLALSREEEEEEEDLVGELDEYF
jgi:hypothetical protein